MKGNAPSFHMGNQLPLEAILQSITPASGTTPPDRPLANAQWLTIQFTYSAG